MTDISKQLFCFGCEKPKALCLFAPSQRKNAKPRCIQCNKKKNAKYRLKANSPITFGQSNSFLFARTK